MTCSADVVLPKYSVCCEEGTATPLRPMEAVTSTAFKSAVVVIVNDTLKTRVSTPVYVRFPCPPKLENPEKGPKT